MDLLSQLIIVSLFALHQYIPSEKMEAKYFDSVVEVSDLEFKLDGSLIASAANQSCRHFMKEAQSELDFNEQELINFSFSIIDQHKDSVTKAQSKPENIKNTIVRICSKDFNSRSFSNLELKELESLVKTEIAILKKSDFESLGLIGLFGKTTLYDRNGKWVNSLFPLTENWLSYSQISPHVSKALIAAEDKAFWVHEGVDLSSMVRIAYEMKSSSSSSLSGGSTLTMQLLKNFYFRNKESLTGNPTFQNSKYKMLLRKVREWFWAKPFEEYQEKLNPGNRKKIILENYLNLMDYGPGIRGIDQATKTFFNKSPTELDLSDAAFIASLFKAPNRYSQPSNYQKYTKPRQKYVLEQMHSLKWEESLLEPISAEDKTNALNKELPLWKRSEESLHKDDTTSYLETYAKEFVLNQVRNSSQIKAIEPELISTIDIDLQKKVQDVIKAKLNEYDNQRFTLARINPARDDRSRIAEIDENDISEDARLYLEEAKKEFLNKGQNVDFVISLGKNFLEAKSKKLYFYEDNSFIKDLESLNKSESSFRSTSTIGQVSVFLNNTEDCKQQSEVLLPEELKTDSTKKHQIPEAIKSFGSCIQLLPPSPISEQITQDLRAYLVYSFLKRMARITPRPNIVPAFVEADIGTARLLILNDFPNSQNDAEILVAPLSSNYLKQNHQRIFKNKIDSQNFQTGHIVWIAKDDEKTNDYHLETPKLQSAAVVLDSNSGEILAHFGGYLPKTSRYFDRSRIAKRQPGSTLKPWLYFLALNKGFEPDSIIRNDGVSFPMGKNKVYRPENYSRDSSGPRVTFEKALTQSLNKAAVGLLVDPRFGFEPKENLREFTDLLVEVNLYEQDKIQVIPSTILGSQEISILDLASSFSFFANGQSIVKPTFFKSLRTGNGEGIYAALPETISVPYSENRDAIHKIQRLMVETANHGTAARLLNFPYKTLGLANCDGQHLGIEGQICFGGKTGTSSDLKDNWFIGISKNFVIGVWVGYDYPESTNSTGGQLALPIFMDIVQQGMEQLPAIEPIIE